MEGERVGARARGSVHGQRGRTERGGSALPPPQGWKLPRERVGCPASAPRRTERVRSERSARHTRSRTARLGAPSGTVHSEIRPMLDHRRSGPRRHQASSIRASGHRTPTHALGHQDTRSDPGTWMRHVVARSPVPYRNDEGPTLSSCYDVRGSVHGRDAAQCSGKEDLFSWRETIEVSRVTSRAGARAPFFFLLVFLFRSVDSRGEEERERKK